MEVPTGYEDASLDEDYELAVVHLVWAVERQTKARILLCATVGLLPREVPPPILLGERSTTVSRRFFIYATEVVVSTRRAMRWFADASRGVALRPNADGALSEPSDENAPRFVVAALSVEPNETSFVTSTKVVPFVTDWEYSPRVRHLIPAHSPISDWSEVERAATLAWLKSELHVDFELFPEYCGSVHLVAPNPLFRELFVRHERDEQEHSFLCVVLTPRAGRTVAGLDVIIEEERATGVGILLRTTVQEPITRIELRHYPEMIRERVVDPVRGLLYDGPYGMFDVSVSITANLVTSKRRVQPPEGAPYEVGLVGAHRTVSTVGGGGPPPREAAALLHSASQNRKQQAEGRERQRWFRDVAGDAVTALRDLIGKADGHVLICDPYFRGDDIRRVVLAIADQTVDVRILTSFDQRRRGDGQHLVDCLAEATATAHTNPVTIRVMRGSPAPIHDRFIVSGNVMWALGSSINKFGARGTLMTRVAYPAPVLNDLEKVWAESSSLDDWIKRRSGGP